MLARKHWRQFSLVIRETGCGLSWTFIWLYVLWGQAHACSLNLSVVSICIWPGLRAVELNPFMCEWMVPMSNFCKGVCDELPWPFFTLEETPCGHSLFVSQRLRLSLKAHLNFLLPCLGVVKTEYSHSCPFSSDPDSINSKLHTLPNPRWVIVL